MNKEFSREELQSLVYTDELTRIHNLRYLREQIPEYLEQAKKQGDSVAFLLFDIDDFKNINDKFGHLAGDKVLSHFIKIIEQKIQEKGIAIRYAGDEFVLVIPKMDKDRHLFSPYGYSVNGVLDKRYFTVHVTPQPEGSYASFETNVMEPDYSERISQVLSIFNPGKFSIVLTTSMDPRCRSLHDTVGDGMPGYVAVEKSLNEFDRDYALSFLNYIRR